MSDPAPQDEEQQLLEQWRAEAEALVEGWNFSHLADRMVEEEPPWDFAAMTRDALSAARHVVDMGTGGGEQLLRFVDVVPDDTVATEGRLRGR